MPEDVLTLTRHVAAIVRRATGDLRYRVLLFGSWASGRAVARSDIDIGIVGPAPVDPRAMAEIREACEGLPTLRTVDVVDLAVVPAELRRVVLSEGVEVEPV